MEEGNDIGRDGGIAGEEAVVSIQMCRARVVVAGADVGVSTQAGCLFTNNQRGFAVNLETFYSEGDVGSSFLEWRLRSSSKRAFNSMTQATCLPVSAARMSDFTNGVSSPTR